jgi:carbon monoxide dehydrogenase subunit G
MELSNAITLPLSPDELFEVLLDVERVAPCIPGASLDGVDDDVYRASVKLKVGPVTAAYQGTVRFLEIDRENRTAVMKAAGTETRGQGKAEATIRASVVGDAHESTLTMDTDLAIRGRVAQFGRGVLNDVSANLMDQFAENLKAQMLTAPAGSEPASGPGPSGPGPSGQAATSAAAKPASGGELSVGVIAVPLLKRAGPVLVAFLLGLLVAGRRR